MDYEQVRRNIYNSHLPGKIVGSFFAVAGSITTLGGFLGKDTGGIVIGLVLLWVAASVIVSNRRSESATYALYAKFEQRTFDWYRETHPTSFRNGQVICHHCGSGRISTRSIRQGTYHREHECTQCGKTLYYSPEQND
jgi:uncharacterized paraquat-inducible protein A